MSERKQILAKRRLCFNCACGNHKASECASKIACKKCGKRHHTSICDSNEKPNNRDVAMTTGEKSEGIFPIVVVEVNGVRCRALLPFAIKRYTAPRNESCFRVFQRVLSFDNFTFHVSNFKLGGVNVCVWSNLRCGRLNIKH